MHKAMPERGTGWDALREQLIELGEGDVDWRSARTAVYVFNAGEDVLRVAKEAYALYQSENALGPAAFPSLRRMEDEVVSMGLSLLHGPEGSCGDMTSGGSESIFLAVYTAREGGTVTRCRSTPPRAGQHRPSSVHEGRALPRGG